MSTTEPTEPEDVATTVDELEVDDYDPRQDGDDSTPPEDRKP